MANEVRHDGAGALEIRFPFDRALVDRIKTLPNRRWNASERFWSVPDCDVVLVVDLLLPARFAFDPPTAELYRRFGGSASIETALRPAAAKERGLFDFDAEPTAGTDEYTVSKLNERVREVLDAAFPQNIWLVGEISGFNRNAHKKHVSFRLAEHDEDGKSVSTVDATLFEQTRRNLERALKRAGEPFRLEDEIRVRLLVRVELYVPWGSYRIVVEDLDVNYTLGEAARRREEIVRRLTELGLVGLNSALPIAAVPLRVGLVTSLGSDAYNDVLRTLQESGYAFRLTAHGARVQGRATEASVLNALDRLRAGADELDVVLICRGGGSRTDLAWFDSEALGRAVARFPLPVIVGIGHEQDHSVLDAVGRRCKTPTAAAALLVETVRQSLQRLERLGLDTVELAARKLERERRLATERGRRLALAARNLLERELGELGHRRARARRGANARLADARRRLTRWIGDLPRATGIHFARQLDSVDGTGRGISRAARRDVAAAGRRLSALTASMRAGFARPLAREIERTDSRSRRLHLVDPQRVVERGYAILRTDDGTVVTEPGQAPPETTLSARLRGGRLRLRAVGPDRNDQGGD